MIRIEHGDCLAVIPRLVAEGIVCDAVVTDPPYGLEFMGREWDAPWKYGMRPYGMSDIKGRAPGPTFTSARNPMCKKCRKHQRGNPARRCLCDAPEFDDVEHRLRDIGRFQQWCEAWGREVIKILRPGGFLLAFGGTRTYHRMVCGLEDAGFVIQDQIAWLYGSGFPKHRSHLKPAHEPIVLAYKPGGKRTMGVDECRIPAGPTIRFNHAGTGDSALWRTGNGGDFQSGSDKGRWPANVCIEDCDEVVECFPQSAGQQGDIRGTEPSPLTDTVYGKRQRVPFNKRVGEVSAERRYTDDGASDFAMLPGARRSDAGSAARFFFSAKAGAEDRWGSKHPTVKPVELIRWLIKLVVPPGGRFLDPFAGSGTAAVAALAEGRNAILIERDDQYVADIRERVAYYEGGGGHSIQVKNRNRKLDLGPLFDGVE